MLPFFDGGQRYHPGGNVTYSRGCNLAFSQFEAGTTLVSGSSDFFCFHVRWDLLARYRRISGQLARRTLLSAPRASRRRAATDSAARPIIGSD